MFLHRCLLLCTVCALLYGSREGVLALTVAEAEGLLCQEAIDALNTDTFSDLRAGLDAAQDIDLGEIPDGQLVAIAPTNDAFQKIYKVLNTSRDAIIDNKDILKGLFSLHVGVASLPSSTNMTRIADDVVSFSEPSEPVSLNDLKSGNVVLGPSNSAKVEDVLCANTTSGMQIVVVDTVLLPGSLAAITELTNSLTPEASGSILSSSVSCFTSAWLLASLFWNLL